MTILFVVSNRNSIAALKGLIGACNRSQTDFHCFFTGEGVQMITNPEIKALLAHAERATVCEHSWEEFAGEAPAPVERGSQTDHSAMIGGANRVVSL